MRLFHGTQIHYQVLFGFDLNIKHYVYRRESMEMESYFNTSHNRVGDRYLYFTLNIFFIFFRVQHRITNSRFVYYVCSLAKT